MSQAGVTTITNVPTPPQFAPNNIMNLFDDFLGIDIHNLDSGNGILSVFKWLSLNNNGGGSDWNVTGLSTAQHPGVIGSFQTTTSSGLYMGAKDTQHHILAQILLGGGAITVNWVINTAILSAAPNTYALRVGLGDTDNADQANGVYFEYTDSVNGGQWQYKTANSSVRTTSNSAIPVTVGWHNLGITINAAATSVSFSVDGVSLGTAITTNIPTLPLTPFVDIVRSAGTIADNTILIDLFYMTNTFSGAR